MKSMKMMKKAQQGFTLIELMIVVAIIGILAAVAIPQYQDYTVKAKVANALTSIDALKTAVAVCIQENGGDNSSCDTTADGGTTGLPAFTATKELASASVANGTITATFADNIGTNVSGKKFTLTPSAVAEQTSIVWKIESSEVTNKAALSALTKNNVATTGDGGGEDE